ncbi:MAG: succinate dehydrogenase assembly factor 2 [Cellvibrionales bacterium]|nr:succinate dehydrogenase assembly factor 2 [Cellvibrionales bacterium]
MTTDSRENDRVYWHSRRGMLEIDVKLMPFAKEVYPTLNDKDKATYQRLLEEEDTQLFAWVLQREVPEDTALCQMMKRILRFARESHT